MSDDGDDIAQMSDVQPPSQPPSQPQEPLFSMLDSTFKVGTCSTGLTQPRTLDMLDDDLVKEGEEGDLEIDDGIEEEDAVEDEVEGLEGLDDIVEDEVEGLDDIVDEEQDALNEISAGQGNMDTPEQDTLGEDTLDTMQDTLDTLDTLDTMQDTMQDTVQDTLDTLDTMQDTVDLSEDKENRRRVIQMPLSKIKAIMKMDPDVRIVTQDAALMVARATELFLQTFTSAAARQAVLGKRKTIQKKDLEYCVNNYPYLEFLEDIPL